MRKGKKFRNDLYLNILIGIVSGMIVVMADWFTGCQEFLGGETSCNYLKLGGVIIISIILFFILVGMFEWRFKKK